MNKQFLDLAKQAVDEKWDTFKIMAEMIALQKEIDAKLCEDNNLPEMAEKIRLQ